VHNMPNISMNCQLDWSTQGQMLDCKRWTSRIVGGEGELNCTPLAKSDIYDCLVVQVVPVILYTDFHSRLDDEPLKFLTQRPTADS